MPAFPRLLVAVAICCLAAARLCAQDAPPAVEGEERQAVLLLAVDPEWDDALAEIRKAADEKNYDRAAEAIDALLTSDRRGFYANGDDVRRTAGLPEVLSRAVNTLPPEALAAYAKRVEPVARRLWEQGEATLGEPELRRLATVYFHSSHGEKAARLLAALTFDRGDFLEAAALWQSLARRQGSQAARPELLARAALAYHLAGAAARAAALKERLQKEQPEARGTLAGQEIVWAKLLEKTLAAPAAVPLLPRPTLNAWESTAGATDAMAVMPACDAPAFALWSTPAAARQSLLSATLGLATGATAPTRWAVQAAVAAGHVTVTLDTGGPRTRVPLPALVHPVLVEGTIICRRADGLIAHSLASGEELWRADFPLFRNRAAGPSEGDARFPPLMGDMGRLTVTHAKGTLYAVGRFRRIEPRGYQAPVDGGPLDTASLVALPLAQRGRKVAWEIGNGQGDSELTRAAKYLTAPTYHEGRLYVPATIANAYYVLCLDAEKGALVWATQLGPLPTATGAERTWQAAIVTEALCERASPVSVAHDRVYSTTNTGLIVALDIATGRPAWSYRYDSEVSGKPSDRDVPPVTHRGYFFFSSDRPLPPVNPLAIARGRVICLPCDADDVLALDAATGGLLWQAPRGGQQRLTALDDDRAALSEPALCVLRTSDGKTLVRSDIAVSGRPAVTPRAALFSGTGQLVRLDLKNDRVEQLDLGDEPALLGNLYSSGGKLVAVNAAGVSVYASYNDALQVLDKRLASARRPADRLAVRLRRAELALSADRLDEAAAQLASAAEDAKGANDKKATAQVRERRFAVALRQALAAERDAAAVKALGAAKSLASGDADEASLLAYGVRIDERAKRYAKAVEQAQTLSEKYAGVEFAAPPDEADDPPRQATGKAYGQAEIARLIQRHGQKVNAAYDQQVANALKGGKRDIEALLAAYQRWPHAARADELLLAAGESLYRDAIKKKQVDLDLAQRAYRVLGEARNRPDSPARLAARAAQALVDLRLRPDVAAVAYEDLKAADPATRISFADFRGTLGEIVQLLAGAMPIAATVDPLSGLDGEVQVVYQLTADSPRLVRDLAGRALRVGPRAFAISQAALCCIDTQINDPAAAMMWRVPFDGPLAAGRSNGQLLADGRVLAVFSPQTAILVDVQSGAVLGTPTLPRVGERGPLTGEGRMLAFSDGRGRLFGFDVRRGEVLWQAVRQGDRDTRLLSTAAGTLFSLHARADEFQALDLTTGQTLLSLRPGGRGSRDTHDVFPTPEGLAAVHNSNGTMAVYDPRAGQEPIVKARVPATVGRMLAADRQWLVVAFDDSEATIGLIDLAAPGEPMPLKPPAADAGVVRRVAFAGERLLVLYAARSAAADGKLVRPTLVSYSVPEGKIRWQCLLLGRGAKAARHVSAWETGRQTIALWAAADDDQPARVILIDARSGEPLATPARFPASGELSSAGRPGCPAVLNGRLLVETEDGVALWKGRL